MNLPPPCTPKDVGARVLAQARIDAQRKATEKTPTQQTDEMEMDESDEEQDEEGGGEAGDGGVEEGGVQVAPPPPQEEETEVGEIAISLTDLGLYPY